MEKTISSWKFLAAATVAFYILVLLDVFNLGTAKGSGQVITPSDLVSAVLEILLGLGFAVLTMIHYKEQTSKRSNKDGNDTTE